MLKSSEESESDEIEGVITMPPGWFESDEDDEGNVDEDSGEDEELPDSAYEDEDIPDDADRKYKTDK